MFLRPGGACIVRTRGIVFVEKLDKNDAAMVVSYAKHEPDAPQRTLTWHSEGTFNAWNGDKDLGWFKAPMQWELGDTSVPMVTP
jgi:hypothetical protein